MPVDLIMFMRWLGLLEAPAHRREMPKGEWFRGGDCPF